MAQKKKDGGDRQRLIVTGCLAERYRDQLKAEIPEIDAVLGTSEVPEIVAAIAGVPRSGRGAVPQGATDVPQVPSPGPAPSSPADTTSTTQRRRVLTTPRHYAYIKIAEGCDYKCAFCIIPTLRGHYRSRPADSIVRVRPATGGARRQGTAAHLAGHDVLRHRPPGARRAPPAAARAQRGGRHRVDPPAVSLPHDDRRGDARRHGRERQGLQVHRPAAAARGQSRPEAHEAARHAAGLLRNAARLASATACRASPCARRSSSASPARPTPTSTSCDPSSPTRRSNTWVALPTARRGHVSIWPSTMMCRRP